MSAVIVFLLTFVIIFFSIAGCTCLSLLVIALASFLFFLGFLGTMHSRQGSPTRSHTVAPDGDGTHESAGSNLFFLYLFENVQQQCQQ